MKTRGNKSLESFSVLGSFWSFIGKRLPLGGKLLHSLAIAALASSAHAIDVNLQWDAPTKTVSGGNIVGALKYKLHYGTAAGVYSSTKTDIATTDTSITGLGNEIFYFAVTAIDLNGLESAKSNELMVDLRNGVVPTPTPTPGGPGLPPTNGGTPTPTPGSNGNNNHGIDIDGDGIGDALFYTGSSKAYNYSLVHSDGSAVSSIEAKAPAKNKLFQAHGNYLGTGYSLAHIEFSKESNNKATLKLNSGSKFNLGRIEGRLMAGCDINGDGYDDIALFKGKSMKILSFNTGKKKVTKVKLARAVSSIVSCGDVNGDASDEILFLETAKDAKAKLIKQKKQPKKGLKPASDGLMLTAYSANGSKVFEKQLVYTNTFGNVQQVYSLGDTDGDGIADFISVGTNGKNFIVHDASQNRELQYAAVKSAILGVFGLNLAQATGPQLMLQTESELVSVLISDLSETRQALADLLGSNNKKNLKLVNWLNIADF